VATYSTGVTATFAGTSFTEIADVSYQWGGGLSRGRGVAYAPDMGQVSITTLGFISSGLWGLRGQFSISGGGLGLTVTAVCTDVSASGELNGVTRYTATFRILDN
jgi:hypothetical protein